MIDGFTQAQVLGGLLAFIVASYIAFFGWLVTSLHSLRREMYTLNRETRLELGARIDTLSSKVDALTIAVSRLEGATAGLSRGRRPTKFEMRKE